MSVRQLVIGQDNTIPSHAFQMLEACTWLMLWRRRRSALGSLHRATTMVAEKGPDKMVKSLAAQMLISRAQRQRSVRMTPRNSSAVAEKVGSQARALGRYRSRYWRCLCKMQPNKTYPGRRRRQETSRVVLPAFSPRPACFGNRLRFYVLPLLIAIGTRDADLHLHLTGRFLHFRLLLPGRLRGIPMLLLNLPGRLRCIRAARADNRGKG